MNLTPRSIGQLRNMEPADVATILDHLHDRQFPDRERTSLVEINAPGGTYRCFIARHRDGSCVLLAIVPIRQEVSP